MAVILLCNLTRAYCGSWSVISMIISNIADTTASCLSDPHEFQMMSTSWMGNYLYVQMNLIISWHRRTTSTCMESPNKWSTIWLVITHWMNSLGLMRLSFKVSLYFERLTWFFERFFIAFFPLKKFSFYLISCMISLMSLRPCIFLLRYYEERSLKARFNSMLSIIFKRESMTLSVFGKSFTIDYIFILIFFIIVVSYSLISLSVKSVILYIV